MKQKILIIEDNTPIRENTSELLQFYDYNVLTATDGEKGLKLALEQIPDLILCDIRMPVMDGYQLLQNIRKESFLNKSRFIFLTASCEKKDIEMAMKMGADDYIIKPFAEKELLEKMRKLLLSFTLPLFMLFKSLYTLPAFF